MGEWKKTQCNFCAVSCGLEMYVEENQIVDVRPDPDSARSHTYCCRKGRSAKFFQHNEDRLNYPLKRVGDHFERISWEQAYREIGAKARKILDDHGPRSISFVGGAVGGVNGPGALASPFLKLAGSQNNFNAGGAEFMGNWWSHGKILGNQMYKAEPDEHRNEVLVFWGSNAYMAHNFLDAKRTIRTFSEDSDKMVITVDPRVSETARMSDMHIKLHNGTDSLFIRALIAYILKKNWQDQEYLDKYVSDWDKTRVWFRNVDIEKSMEVCGIPMQQLDTFARILTTKKWGCHMDLGLFFGRNSTSDCYLVIVLEAVCGMLLTPGGCTVSQLWAPKGETRNENDPKTWRLPVTGRFPILASFPTHAIPDEILGDNEDRIRMMFVSISNPCRSYSDTKRMEEALSKLDLLVVTDCVMTETARLAHYVLPGKTAYEGRDFTVFPYNYPEISCQLRQPVVQPEGERREDSMIIAELAEAIGLVPELPESLHSAARKAVETGNRMQFFLKLVAWVAKGNVKYFKGLAIIVALTLGRAMGSANASSAWAALLIGPMTGKGYAERAGFKPDAKKYPVLSKLPKFKDLCTMDAVYDAVNSTPEGVIVGRHDESRQKDFIFHEDHKLHLWCEEIDSYLRRITPEREAAALALPEEFPMILSAGRHSDNGYNTTMRNPATYQYRKPYAMAINPLDAQEMGFSDGETVRVTTRTGSVTIPLEYTWQTNRGYVLFPHHFGFDFQGETVGSAVNLLTSTDDCEELTGDATWRFIPCRVEAVKEGI